MKGKFKQHKYRQYASIMCNGLSHRPLSIWKPGPFY